MQIQLKKEIGLGLPDCGASASFEELLLLCPWKRRRPPYPSLLFWHDTQKHRHHHFSERVLISHRSIFSLPSLDLSNITNILVAVDIIYLSLSSFLRSVTMICFQASPVHASSLDCYWASRFVVVVLVVISKRWWYAFRSWIIIDRVILEWWKCCKCMHEGDESVMLFL